jgi:hypothetical protein
MRRSLRLLRAVTLGRRQQLKLAVAMEITMVMAITLTALTGSGYGAL